MMCLGWRQQQQCNRIDQVIPGASGTLQQQAQAAATGAVGAAACPDITWFWVGTAAVFLAAVTKK